MGVHGPKPEPSLIRGHPPGGVLEALRRQIAQIERSGRKQADEVPVPSGCGPLDQLLPERGFRRGTLIEWLAEGQGSGAETLALGVAREACRQGGALVVLDDTREFYPPAAAGLKIALEQMVVVQAGSATDNAWALDQALRCPGVAAALAWPEKLEGRAFRRLQLAAEEGGALGLLVRPECARHEPSWAEVRLLIEPLPFGTSGSGRRLKIQLMRCRGGTGGGSVEVEIDDETRAVHLAPRLAHPAAARRAAGA
jgi:hypothetical protein